MRKKPTKRSEKAKTARRKAKDESSAINKQEKAAQAEETTEDTTSREFEPATEHREPLTITDDIQRAPQHTNLPITHREPWNGKTRPDPQYPTKGRPSRYCEELVLEIERLAETGMTNVEICRSIKLPVETFNDWQRRYPLFSMALKKARNICTMHVENALYRTALGYDYTEEQVSKDGDAVEVRKHQTGSVKAQTFWLTNRRPDRWKNKIETTLEMGREISQMVVAIKRRED